MITQVNQAIPQDCFRQTFQRLFPKASPRARQQPFQRPGQSKVETEPWSIQLMVVPQARPTFRASAFNPRLASDRHLSIIRAEHQPRICKSFRKRSLLMSFRFTNNSNSSEKTHRLSQSCKRRKSLLGRMYR